MTPLVALVFALLTPAASARALNDLQGNSVTVPDAPKRVAVLMPALGEAMSDLGAGDLLIGAPEYTELPPALRSKITVLGPYPFISAEKVYSMKPDLVVASVDGNDPALVTRLRALKLPVLVADTRSLETIAKTFELLAAATGRGAEKAARFRKELAAASVKEPGPHPKLFLQLGWEPLVTVSDKSFVGEVIAAAGFENAFAHGAQTYPRPSMEKVVAANPDLIVICPLTPGNEEAEKAKKGWARFTSLTAVKTGRVHVMPLGMLTKPGFHVLDGLRELKKLRKP
jgi:ABC-type Fe3+-hydroxamate transport system substrate-binding protein